MSAVTYKHPDFKARVEELCRAVADDPSRSIYVKPRTMKVIMREDFPEMSDEKLGHNIGRVLIDLEYTERWGSETYKLLVDRMD